jgi:hypothetical protein
MPPKRRSEKAARHLPILMLVFQRALDALSGECSGARGGDDSAFAVLFPGYLRYTTDLSRTAGNTDRKLVTGKKREETSPDGDLCSCLLDCSTAL